MDQKVRSARDGLQTMEETPIFSTVNLVRCIQTASLILTVRGIISDPKRAHMAPQDQWAVDGLSATAMRD